MEDFLIISSLVVWLAEIIRGYFHLSLSLDRPIETTEMFTLGGCHFSLHWRWSFDLLLQENSVEPRDRRS